MLRTSTGDGGESVSRSNVVKCPEFGSCSLSQKRVIRRKIRVVETVVGE